MRLDLFPNEYKNTVDCHAQDTIKRFEADRDKNIYQFQRSLPSEPTSKYAPLFMGFFGAVLGVVIGFVVGAVADLIIHNHDYDYISYVIFGGSIVLLTSIGVIGGAVTVRSENRARRQIEMERANTEYITARIIDESKQKTADYLNLFEQEVKAKTDVYAESSLAKEVTLWMCEPFAESIANAERDSYIEKIDVPFNYNVFSDRITSNIGTFDFKKNRCENLGSRVEQAALARALAAAIQLEISIRFPQDSSGPDNRIDIKTSYGKDSADVEILYSAENGYYKPIRSW